MMDGLKEKINNYLEQVGILGDSVALQLLRETLELLNMQHQIDSNGAKTPNLNDTLKAIQQSLARIKSKKATISKPQDYAVITAAAAAQSG